MIVAIDLGLTGAIAVESSGEVAVEDMPVTTIKGKTVRKAYNIQALAELLRDVIGSDSADVIVEKLHAMPTNGSIGSFSLGIGLGAVRGICAVLGVRLHEVPPTVWKKAMGLSSDKDDSLALARKEFPQLVEELKLKKHHNRAEALLLLHYFKGLN